METILFGLVLVSGLYMAWNIGANDVANAMGTSVGSGALTLRGAVIMAACLEFSGAFFFGSNVSETIQKGIVAPEVFQQDIHLFVYGMLAAMIAAGIWLQIASYYGWPVSTTHAIVGAVAGFGVVVGGLDAIYWKNIGMIVASWIISPLTGGILGFLTFTYLRKWILYTDNPLRAAKTQIPLLAFILFSMLTLLLLSKGLAHLHLELTFSQTLVIVLAVGGLGATLFHLLVRDLSPEGISGILPHSIDQVNGEATHPDYIAVEKGFNYMQMMTAGLMAFSHGANDVANAIGPLSAAVVILQTGSFPEKTMIPLWILFLGGFGIVVGLATWGWRVIETIGRKITELTPTRGFSAEFGAAATILIASRLGLPISTTHTLVGAVIGVGLARGIGALNLSTTREIFFSWAVTVPAGAVICVAFFYLFVFIFG